MSDYAKNGEASVQLPELIRGDTGPAVGWVQALLCMRGYRIPAETAGFFDGETENAVADFQRDMGMTATGTVTAGTWAFLLLME